MTSAKLWNVADTRGSAAHVGTQGSFKTVGHIDGGFGFKLGRRLAGYAYPANGPVHAVSKKLLPNRVGGADGVSATNVYANACPVTRAFAWAYTRADVRADSQAGAGAHNYVVADPLGDLRADHGHLRADVDFSVTTKAPKSHHHYRQHRTKQSTRGRATSSSR